MRALSLLLLLGNLACTGGVALGGDAADEGPSDAPADDAGTDLPDMLEDDTAEPADESGVDAEPEADAAEDAPAEDVEDTTDTADAGPPCGDECASGAHTACTCDPADPCGWARNRNCDAPACADATTEPVFDDSIDCTGGACGRSCARYEYDACTCDPADPCGWAHDGYCDGPSCQLVVPGAHFADPEDCGGTPTTRTFITTSVDDGLDNLDFDVFASGLRRLGYRWVVRDTNVNTPELAGYLGLGVTFLYHTGHGFPGGAATAGGAITVGDVPHAVAAHHTIWATCLTLSEPWTPAFGPTAESVLGYTDVSFDIADDEVARLFAESLGRGSTPMFAWYEANAPLSSLADRWAGYVRERSDIVEYSARSGRLPVRDAAPDPAAEEWVSLGSSGRLFAAAALLDAALPFAGPAHRRASRMPEPPRSGAVERGWTALGPTSASSADAIVAAETFWTEEEGGLPEGAVLDVVAEVVSRREGADPIRVGWLVRFSRVLDGVPVRSNGLADHFAVLLGPSGAVAWSRWWPATTILAAPFDSSPLGASAALRLAAAELDRAAKGELRLRDAEPVWGVPRGEGAALLPAWRFTGSGGLEVVVDAATGRILR